MPVFILLFGASLFTLVTLYYSIAIVMLPFLILKLIYECYVYVCRDPSDVQRAKRVFWNSLPLIVLATVLMFVYWDFYFN